VCFKSKINQLNSNIYVKNGKPKLRFALNRKNLDMKQT
tara:strand:+ start:1326 stop:1439 length:114 start_codon:yes stop_codon:yes gene_type:complete